MKITYDAIKTYDYTPSQNGGHAHERRHDYTVEARNEAPDQELSARRKATQHKMATTSERRPIGSWPPTTPAGEVGLRRKSGRNDTARSLRVHGAIKARMSEHGLTYQAKSLIDEALRDEEPDERPKLSEALGRLAQRVKIALSEQPRRDKAEKDQLQLDADMGLPKRPALVAARDGVVSLEALHFMGLI